MKKVLLSMSLVLLAGSASAHGFYHGGYRGPYYGGGGWGGGGWVAPALIGGVIGYEIARNQPPVVVQQPPVIVQNPPPKVCSPWTEIQNPDGTITRTRTCNQ